MYRNSKSSWRQGSLDRMAATGYDSRTPLYPIGPTLSQPGNYVPIYGGTGFPRPASPYVKHTPLPPSYETKLLERQSRISQNPNYEQRERKMLAINQSEIEGEQRRRETLKQSYEREVQRLTVILQKNIERKDRLKSELEILENDGRQLQNKLSELPPVELPKLGEALEKKQEQVLTMKNHLFNEVRKKEQELTEELNSQLNDWELKLKDKEKVLSAAEQRKNIAKQELIKIRREEPERLVLGQVQETIRERKYQEFLYDHTTLKDKITKLAADRQAAIRESQAMNTLKEGVMRDQLHRLEQLKSQILKLQVSVVELESRNKEIDRANENLQEEHNQKEKLVTQYEDDTKQLRLLISNKDAEFSAHIQRFRSRPNQVLGPADLETQLQQMDKLVRQVQSENFRLRTDFKRLTDLLSSGVSKSIYQTFNDMRFS